MPQTYLPKFALRLEALPAPAIAIQSRNGNRSRNRNRNRNGRRTLIFSASLEFGAGACPTLTQSGICAWRGRTSVESPASPLWASLGRVAASPPWASLGRVATGPPWAGRLPGFTLLFKAALVVALCRGMPFAAARLAGLSGTRPPPKYDPGHLEGILASGIRGASRRWGSRGRSPLVVF